MGGMLLTSIGNLDPMQTVGLRQMAGATHAALGNQARENCCSGVPHGGAAAGITSISHHAGTRNDYHALIRNLHACLTPQPNPPYI